MREILVAASAVLVLTGCRIYPAEESRGGEAAEGKAVKKQAVCPVMGGQVNTNIYADADGKRVYFCCNACPSEFNKDPASYIKKLEAEGVTLDKTPQDATTNAPAVGPRGQDEHKEDEHGAHHH